MQVEINQNSIKVNLPIKGILITPAVDEDYWLLRVPVSEHQAIVAFPKFGTIGIGFQHEEDWNTNLPYTNKAQKIFNHISHNKGDDSISDEDCIKAIEMLQEAIKEYLTQGGLNGSLQLVLQRNDRPGSNHL